MQKLNFLIYYLYIIPKKNDLAYVKKYNFYFKNII